MLNLSMGKCLLVLILIVVVVTFYEYQLLKLREQLLRIELKRGAIGGSIDVDISKPPNDVIVVYNRVPKTGSTSFMGVAYDLCKKNDFHVLHINVSGNNHVLSLNNQYRLIRNITRWRGMKPAIYHGHFAHINFAKFSVPKPLYINLIRRPLDRFISYYYFLRYGDDFRPYLTRRKHGDNVTFDACVEQNLPDCSPEHMWLQVPFFCGHAANCWKPGNKWALNEAKRNLVSEYFFVGLTEKMPDFISVLEAALPRLFRNASEHYKRSNRSHLRQTTTKYQPQPDTIEKIQQSAIWQMENEFYEFAQEQFYFVRKYTLKDRLQQRFFFEKIRPKVMTTSNG